LKEYDLRDRPDGRPRKWLILLILLTLRSWLAELDSNWATILTASILRNQQINGFELAQIWSTTLCHV
jgi:hypothetical protein